jgi:hypothetical protein
MNPPEVGTQQEDAPATVIETNELERLKRLVRLIEKYTEENGISSFGEMQR